VPSAKVVDGYGVVSVTLKDGAALAGVLQKQSPTAITVLENNAPHEILRSDIKEMSPPASAMQPMGTILTMRELRDLVSYLETLK
jgi:quinoprotein glucose dehydrogenase